MLVCSSCKKEVTHDYVKFMCPSCGKAQIIRCLKCREMVTSYVCPECSFEGP